MTIRYLKVYRKKILLFIIIIGLIVAASVTKGKTAITTSILAGIAMIYAAVSFIIWIVKAPVKKDLDEGV